MNYLISKFNCYATDLNKKIIKNVKYSIKSYKSCLFFGFAGELPLYVDFNLANKNLLKVEYNNDNYFILRPTKIQDVTFTTIKHLNVVFNITISSTLSICTDKENLLNLEIENLQYSHFEVIGNILLIYFLGVRNFVVIIQNSQVLIASYFDEYNEKDNEKIFMVKLKDVLNHGRVFKVKDKEYQQYLVYLDDNELNLNSRFLGFVFLDCLLAKNYKYCNNLLCENIKQKKEETISNFFPEFDYYFEVDINEFVLLNKNALAGIYKFETNNLVIENIIPQNPQHF